MASDARAEFDPKEIARAAFPTAFRGYDQDAVRRYLSRLATAISRAQQLELLGSVDADHSEQAQREADLQMEASELRVRVDELEDLLRSMPTEQGPVDARDLDESELIELLGQETARVLEQARSAASDILHRAEAEADAVRDQADLDAKSMTDEAEEVLAGARMEADETRAAAMAEAKRSQSRSKAEAKRSREAAKAQADELLAEAASKIDEELQVARIEAGQILAEAEQLREEVLGDLVRRRRLYREQLVRMSEARDRLVQALSLARGEIESVSDDLVATETMVVELDELESDGGPTTADTEEVRRLISELNSGLVPEAATRSKGIDVTGETAAVGAFATSKGELTIGESDDVDELQMEYLNLDDGDDAFDDESSPEPVSGEGLMALNLAASANGHSGNGTGGGAAAASNGAVALAGVEVAEADPIVEDDLTLDLSSMPVMGAAPGTMHRAATRGDLPRSTPYGGTLPAAFEGRDIALARALPGFRRRLKRAVNDDQSHVLDRLRAGRGMAKVADMPTAAEQLERYTEALQPSLQEVVRSGAELLNSSEVPMVGVENLCTQLARHIVECLRSPTVDAVESATSPDREAILDPVRATYRDFRNGVLPDLIEDALHEAFALGLFSAITDDEDVVWLTDPRLDPDPICEENSAAPALAKGTPFPSGHARPLSMPGCRCLAIPAR
ncbi:MAG: DivIVA domain-containing protein [Actinomycetota bacterium]